MIAPPAVQGLGNGSGFVMMLQDRSANAGYRGLEGVTGAMMGAAMEEPKVTQVFSLFNTGTPRIKAEVDRDLAYERLGIPKAYRTPEYGVRVTPSLIGPPLVEVDNPESGVVWSRGPGDPPVLGEVGPAEPPASGTATNGNGNGNGHG